MARFPSLWSGRPRGRTRMWMHIISGLLIVILVLLIIGVVIPYIRGPNPLDKNEDEIVEIATDANADEHKNVEMATVTPVFKPVVKAEPNLSAPQRAISADASLKADELISEAAALVNNEPSRIIEARETLNEALLLNMTDKQRAFIKKKLSELADKWLFSKTVFLGDNLCENYNVQVGDLLSKIGEQFKVPWEILKEINNLPRPESLRAGATIKVINGPFHVKIYRSSFTMDLYLQKTFIRSFRVGLGMPGRETPKGFWVVKPGGKLKKPIWTDPDTGKVYHPEDPNYPLGSVWIELEGIEGEAKDKTSFGIHGTNDPKTIGTAGSRGCIRLHNGDAILIHNLLVPKFSQVQIVE